MDEFRKGGFKMRITFYTTTDEKNKIGKTLENPKEISGNNKETFDEMTGTIILSKEVFDLKYNYCFIHELNKYYFINPPQELNGGLYKINLTEDCLETYKNEILQITCTIMRNEKLRDGYLGDQGYLTKTYKQIVTKKFPNAMENDSVILMTLG